MISLFEKQLLGYRLTTAEITYRFPDYPNLLQNFIWQDLDIHPNFPVLTRFLKFWEHNLEGSLHSVTIANSKLVTATEFRAAGCVLTLQ
jgi:uncharacterized protein Usg